MRGPRCALRAPPRPRRSDPRPSRIRPAPGPLPTGALPDRSRAPRKIPPIGITPIQPPLGGIDIPFIDRFAGRAIIALGDSIRTEMRPICGFEQLRRTPRRAGARYQRQAGNNDGCKITRCKPDGGRNAALVRYRTRGRTQAVRDHAFARRTVARATTRPWLGSLGREDGRRRAEHDIRRQRRGRAHRFHRLHVARLSGAEGVSEPARDRLDFRRAGRRHDQRRGARDDSQLLLRLRDAAVAVRMDFARARPCARDGRARSRRSASTG